MIIHVYMCIYIYIYIYIYTVYIYIHVMDVYFNNLGQILVDGVFLGELMCFFVMMK